MFEIFATITDEYGSRTIPTGYGFSLEASALNKEKELKFNQPDVDFHTEYVCKPDYWNCF